MSDQAKSAMRVFVAAFLHETSAFSPIPTGMDAYTKVIPHTAERRSITDASRRLPGYGALIRAAEQAGCEVHASEFMFAQPSARCSREIYEALRDRILDDLNDHKPFDLVLLFLHGAQMAISHDDCEGDILAGIRRIVGPETRIGVLLDLHANVTSQMIAGADVMLACREYPHIDFDERAEQLFRLCFDAARGQLRPRLHYHRVPMLSRFHTTAPGMKALTVDCRMLEGQDGLLALSLIHGFPNANTPDTGAGMLFVTDGDGEGPLKALNMVRQRFFDLRSEALDAILPLSAVLDRISSAASDGRRRPFVVADHADNAGGGAASDSTFVLEALLRRGFRNVAIGLFWDPVAVDFSHDAGEGSRFKLRLGGKCGIGSGHPLDVEATVLRLRDDVVQDGLGLQLRLGRAAALDIDGIKVVVNSERQQLFSPNCFTDFGITLGALDAVFVKSTQHFRAAFDGLAREVLYADTPGEMTAHITAERYDGVSRPIWPLDPVTSLQGLGAV